MKIAQSCPTLCDPMDYNSPWNSPGQNTRVGCHSLLQGIFPAQGSNPGLPHCRWILYQQSHTGSPYQLYLNKIGRNNKVYWRMCRLTQMLHHFVVQGLEHWQVSVFTKGRHQWMTVLQRVRSIWQHVQFATVPSSFATPWTVAHQAPLSMGFSRQEYWSGLPCPPPGDLPNPGTEPRSLSSPEFAGTFFTTAWEAHLKIRHWQNFGTSPTQRCFYLEMQLNIIFSLFWNSYLYLTVNARIAPNYLIKKFLIEFAYMKKVTYWESYKI